MANWQIFYHPQVENDLKILGNSKARQILKAIDERLIHGEPAKIGKTLTGALIGYRRIRVGNDARIIYKIYTDKVEIYIIAALFRKDDMVYKATQKRLTNDEGKL